jgi:maleate cis-trans isomerase
MNMENTRALFDGWKGRIGLVATAPGNSTEAEFNKYRPHGVAVLTTRTPLTESTSGGIRQMNSYVEDAAVMLAKNAHADVVLLSSTAGSFVNGRKAEVETIKHLESLAETNVVTSTSCLLNALSLVQATRITLITPSSQSLNDAETAYLSECGIEVNALGGFFYKDPRAIMSTTPQDVYSLVRKTDNDRSEAIVISCSGLHVMEIIDEIEVNMGKPVLTSNQFGLWGALRSIGVKEKIEGIGRIFVM